LILVFMVCQCNVYVIPRSLGRKDLGYKGYEPHAIANFVALLVLLCLLELYLFSFSVSSAVDLFPACLRFSNMNTFAVDSFPACLRFSNMNTFAVDSLPASFPSRLMDPCVVAFSPAWFPRSVLGLRRFCYLLAMYFPQTLFTSLSTFSWNVPPRGDALRHQSVQMATLSNESDLDAQQYLADNAGSSLPDHQSAASSSDPSSLFPSDLRLMASFYALPPIPCLSSATTLWIFLCILETLLLICCFLRGCFKLCVCQAAWSGSFRYLQNSFHGACFLLAFLVWCCLQLCPLVDTLRGCSVLTDGG
jgi:hypothetical protein